MQKITAQGEVRDISIWQKTHDDTLLPATYRLYLTATPRVYGPKAKERLQKTKKEKNLDEDLMLFSMDDEGLFGSEIYRLDFANAIEQGLLSDFRVIISYVSEEFAAKYLATLTKEQNNSNLNIIDAGKMVAFANAINKRHLTYVDEQGRFEACSDDGKPMKRAVVFHSSIRDSKFTTKCFAQGLISRSIDFTHIDGKDNAYEKASKLSWLKESSENTRVLSNAKCLTEGIDVPNLDAVCFFSKRDSVVDVVQAVGRAIRKADSKKYGYIILPLVLTEQEIAEYDKTLKGDKFKIVWQVLIALRSHDERLIDEARVNEILQLEREFEEKEVPEATLFTIDDLFKEMKNAVPKNLGDLQYWENYASKVGDIMQALIRRIQALLDSSPAIQKLFSTFCKALQGNLNASFDESEAIALVAQHIITKPIFECIFPSLDFTTFDKVSAELEKLHTKLLEQGLNAETKTLEKFYTSVRQSAEYAKSDKSKQSLIKNLYDTLFKQAFKKTQEKLGIVYTPIEGVDFIIHSTQYLLQKHFGKSLGDRHIHIADPFVGTGTFITRLIQSGYLDSNLESKFAKELWANEITLLGYYIAQINIATTYHERLTKLNGDSAGDSALGNHSADFGDLEATADPKSSSAPKSPKNYESPTANLRILEEEKQAGRENTPTLESQGGDTTLESTFDNAPSPSLRGGGKATNEAIHKSTQVDSSLNAESVKTPQAAGFCDDFVGCQGGGEGIYLSGNEQALAADSRKSAQKPTPEIKLFDNLLFTDTFNTYAPDSKGFIGSKDGTQTTIDSLPYLEKNYAKIQEFKNTEFKIFMSNPPYSAGQKSANDDNANEKSPHIDKRISETYRAKSLATSTKNTSFDSFKRALRFMSDRIGESGGIIGLVVNGSFLDSNSDDGLRACLADEFDYIYIFNLRGNARTAGDARQKEGGGFFDSGSRTPVAICFFVKLDSSQATSSLRGDEIAEAIHKETAQSSSRALPEQSVAIHKSTQVDSSAKMDCHALPSDKARNDDKTSPLSHCETSAGSRGNPNSDNAQNPNDSQAEAKVDFSTAQNVAKQLGGRIFDEKAGLCSGEQGDKTGASIDAVSYKLPAFSQKANAKSAQKAKIYYYDIGDYLDRQTKLNIIQDFKSIESMEAQGRFTLITPNKDYDWINQRDYSFMAFTPMGSTGQKLKPLAINAKGELELEIFELFSQGVVTGKDNWSFNFSKENLAKNIALCIDTYNTEREALATNPAHKLCNDLSKVTWGGSLDKRVRANRELVFDESRIRICSYRPFTKEFLYFDNGYNHSHCQMDKIYPFGNKGEAIACINGDFENVAIQVLGVGATHQFSALASNGIVDLEHISKGHCFPLYYYERVESSAENGQMTMDYDLAESMDCHATATALARNDNKTDTLSPSSRADEIGVAIHKNTQMDSSMDCHATATALARNDDKKVDSSRAYYRRKDAIRDEALAFFQKAYNDSTITKEAMFYYIYAILNHKDYIAKYKDNLSKMLPRIPLMQDFWGFVASGRALAQLHLEYESFCDVESMSVACGAFACLKADSKSMGRNASGLFGPSVREKAAIDMKALDEESFKIHKISFESKIVRDCIVCNDTIAIVNIPPAAHTYKVNGKSAIEWILDRYKISTDKASGIVNDPNLYESTSGALKGLKGGRYVCALLLSVIEMSVRTSKILESMPEYKLLESST